MRIESFVDSIEKAGIDVFLVTRVPNIFYFAGTTSGGVLVIPRGAEPVLLVPTLNLSLAEDEVNGIEVKSYTMSNILKQITNICNELKPKKVGFDELKLETYTRLSKNLGNTELNSGPDYIFEMRKVKDEKELKMMKRAAELADVGMEAVREFLEEGVREYEVAAEASYAMRKEGAQDYSFPFIVASGPRSAYPHAGVTDRKVRRGDFVIVDMGAKYNEYCTDLTRTFVVGSPSKEQRSIYETVMEANATAFTEIVKHAEGAGVDKVARDIIKRDGYGKHFVHGLGHGVGLEVHEPPSLSENSLDTLRVGNVVTDEPGVYIPRFGGVRIEDTVLVTSSGPISFTRFDRDIDTILV